MTLTLGGTREGNELTKWVGVVLAAAVLFLGACTQAAPESERSRPSTTVDPEVRAQLDAFEDHVLQAVGHFQSMVGVEVTTSEYVEIAGWICFASREATSQETFDQIDD